jgi:lysophospholipase L1-like esterase
VNLGVVGGTSAPEATALVARLRATDDPPDAVVQLDGFNDAMAATGRVLRGKGDDPAPLRLDATGTLEALQRQDGIDPATTAAIADLAARSYGSAQDRMRAASSRAGADHLAFFQPDAFASPLQLAQVRSLYATVPGILQDRGLGSVLDATAAALAGRTVDLRHAYDATGAPVLLDVVHTNEEGARLVADEVYGRLQPLLG